MNKSLELALTGLIPTLTGPLPHELLDLAQSLLAQSRNRISSLKSTEEAARVYVCAHIACERLEKSLDLPPIEPRPPLPKKAYANLHSQFQKSLPTKLNRKPSRTTTTAAAATASSSSAAESKLTAEVTASIKSATVAIGAPAATHFVLSGVSEMISSPGGKPFKNPHALVAAVTLFVIERLMSDKEERGWKRGEGYEEKRTVIVNALTVPGVSMAMVDKLVKDIAKKSKHWKWLTEVPDGIGLTVGPAVKETTVVASKKRLRERGAESGVGSMMQERVDYLNAKRRKGFEEWKTKTLRKVGEIETQMGITAVG